MYHNVYSPLQDYENLTGRPHVFQTDTDSVMLTTESANYLRSVRPHLYNSPLFGTLDVEKKDITCGIYIRPKVYYVKNAEGEKARIKGIRQNSRVVPLDFVMQFKRLNAKGEICPRVPESQQEEKDMQNLLFNTFNSDTFPMIKDVYEEVFTNLIEGKETWVIQGSF